MSIELPDKPRKIGEHFTFNSLSLAEIDGKPYVTVEYSYDGENLTQRTIDSSQSMNRSVIDQLVKPIKNLRGYKIEAIGKVAVPEEMFKVKIDGSNEIVYVGHTVSSKDRVKVSSPGTSIPLLKYFLTVFEESMEDYKE